MQFSVIAKIQNTLYPKCDRVRYAIVMITNLLLWIITLLAGVSAPIEQVCTGDGLQPRPADFTPQGIILTTWSRETMWAYDIARNTRYPIDNSAPCGTNCHLSPDARSITYRDNIQGAVGAMWLNGGNRRVIINNATEVEWWSDNRLLVWSERNAPYLLTLGTEEREPLNVRGLVNVQPGGYWGMTITADDDLAFVRQLIDTGGEGVGVLLGADEPYFNAAAWSPDGAYLAFVGRGEHDDNFRRGGEIFLIQPGDEAPTRTTDFTATYGAVRINGLSPSGLSWSPDGSLLAFWVMPREGVDIETDIGAAQLHILEVETGEIRAYCDYATTRHTPNPPRLVWSPDGSKIVFGGQDTIRGGQFSTALIALDVASGVFVTLSLDLVPAVNNNPDVIAWGLSP